MTDIDAAHRSAADARQSRSSAGTLASLAVIAIFLGLVFWYLLPNADAGRGAEGTAPRQSVVQLIDASAN